MNHEIKNDPVPPYSFEELVKHTEKITLMGYRKIGNVPATMYFAVDNGGKTDIGIGFLPQVDGMSNNEVIKKLGTAMAQDGQKVKAVGVVCEAFVSDRLDVAPSKDPKAKDVILMAFSDSTGKKQVITYKAQKGKATKMKGMDGAKFHGLVDSFWEGYKATPQVNDSIKPTIC